MIFVTRATLALTGHLKDKLNKRNVLFWYFEYQKLLPPSVSGGRDGTSSTQVPSMSTASTVPGRRVRGDSNDSDVVVVRRSMKRRRVDSEAPSEAYSRRTRGTSRLVPVVELGPSAPRTRAMPATFTKASGRMRVLDMTAAPSPGTDEGRRMEAGPSTWQDQYSVSRDDEGNEDGQLDDLESESESNRYLDDNRQEGYSSSHDSESVQYEVGCKEEQEEVQGMEDDVDERVDVEEPGEKVEIVDKHSAGGMRAAVGARPSASEEDDTYGDLKARLATLEKALLANMEFSVGEVQRK